MRTFVWVLVLVAAPIAVAAEPSEGKKKVAVLALEAQGNALQPIAGVLSDVVATDLSRRSWLQVLSSSDIASMLGFERQKALLGCSEEASCMAEIGAALGSEVLVSGSLGKLGDTFVLTLRAYDTVRGVALGRDTATLEKEGELIAAATAMLAKLFPPPPSAAALAPATSTAPPPLKLSPGWFVLMAAGALAVVGAILGALSLGDVGVYGASLKAGPEDNAAAASARTKANVADGFFVGASVTGIVGVVWLLLQPRAAAQVKP